MLPLPALQHASQQYPYVCRAFYIYVYIALHVYIERAMCVGCFKVATLDLSQPCAQSSFTKEVLTLYGLYALENA